MRKFELPVDFVISQLGYDTSSNLYMPEKYQDSALSLHARKILSDLDPYAAYIVNDAPFIVFFDRIISDEIALKDISKRIWNAQIPVAIFCDENSVKVFNGSSINVKDYTIKQVREYAISECTAESDFSFWNIADPLFWERYLNDYSDTRLNKCLLDNISYLTNELKNTYHIAFATKLVLRLIFIRYLIDRGVDLAYQNFSADTISSKTEFLRIVRDKQSLYDLFNYLKTKFNGNLFDLDDEICCSELTSDVFDLLADFLSGEITLSSGQVSLFSMYDFNIIPVELISNIYEILLGKEVQDKDNAFYTPNYLVEYILNRTVTRSLKEKAEFTVLDPACGSGIFLVNCYRKIIEEKLTENQYCEDDTLLANLLSHNIFGIDINDEAIDVTIFSLYLTVLDYKDPKTLSGFELPNLKGKNLFVADFFDDFALKVLSDLNIHFDFIIGNPPWGSVKSGLHVDYCRTNGYSHLQQNNEISRSFIFRAKDFCGENTICAFVLHSKLLYNQKRPAVKFRKYLLEHARLISIVEMSSVRKLVFENAKAPAIILSFKYNEGNNLKNKFSYTSFKPNIFFRLFNLLVAEKNDVKFIPQELLYRYDWAWKTIVYGFSGDVENIIKLKENFITINEAIKSATPPLLCGSGIQDHLGDAQDATSLLGLPLLNSDDGVDHFSISISDESTFGEPKIHRTRNRELFNPPHCFTAKGLNCSNYKMRSVFSDKQVVCKETMYVIKGNDSQTEVLYNLVGLMNSSFFAYLNLMVGSSLGIEREQRFMTEVLSFPYTFSKEIARQTEALHVLCNSVNQEYETEVDAYIEELDHLVMTEFGLANNDFVDYALTIQIPELIGYRGSDAYRKVTVDDLKRYSECFKKQFSAIYSQLGKTVSIKLYPNILNCYAAVELFISDDVSQTEDIISECLDDKELFSRFILSAYNDKFYQMRDVVFFGDSSFYILKPNYYKYWHPAISKLDLSDVIDQIMADAGGEDE